MKRILFVEDNELLLELYGLFLSGERDHWEATLAPNAELALKILQHTAFDVVLSDLQLPGMTGIELLIRVRELHPQSSRIIVSGVSDQAAAADSLRSTHLFIPKPFNVKLLKSTLARIVSLDAYLNDEKLRRLAGKMRTLPTFPTLYLEIIKEIESPNASIQGIANIVAQDPGITAKILQLANSAAVGLPVAVNDPVDAVQLLGMNTVRSLVLSAQVYSCFAPGRLPHFSATALWEHLMKCGTLARDIMHCEQADPSETDAAFTAGMLHDIGKLMLADGAPEEFAHAMALAKAEEIPLHEAELEIFGATHAGLAAFLLGLWGLPAAVVEAVAFHHDPEKGGLKQGSALTAVHAANALCHEGETNSCNLAYLKEIGAVNRLSFWRDLAHKPAKETST